MGYHARAASTVRSLVRPKMLIETARIGARLYCRERDLGAAIRGTTGGSPAQIVAHLGEVERNCEGLRRTRAPVYRPTVHVQVLSALLAEAAQAKASGSDSLRAVM